MEKVSASVKVPVPSSVTVTVIFTDPLQFVAGVMVKVVPIIEADIFAEDDDTE